VPVLLVGPSAAMAILVTAAESIARARGDIVSPIGYGIAARCSFFLAYPFLPDDPSATLVMAVFSGTMVLGSLPAVIAVARARRLRPDPALRRVLGNAVGLGAAGALVALAVRGNVVVLAHLGERGDVSLYEGSWRVYQLFLYVTGAVSTAVTPYAAGALARDGLAGLWRTVAPGLALVGLTGLAAGVLVVADARALGELMLGDSHGSAVPVLRVLGATLPLTAVTFYVQSGIVVPLLQLRAMFISAAALFALTIGGTLLLAPGHGALGTAYAMMVAQAAALAVLGASAFRALRGYPRPTG
jgi:O-antigen/teichoic acid export membrane protein